MKNDGLEVDKDLRAVLVSKTSRGGMLRQMLCFRFWYYKGGLSGSRYLHHFKTYVFAFFNLEDEIWIGLNINGHYRQVSSINSRVSLSRSVYPD